MTGRPTFSRGGLRKLIAIAGLSFMAPGCGDAGPLGSSCEDNTYCADGRYQCPSDEAEPYFVAQTSGVVELAVGSLNACVRLVDGTLRCWGRESTDVNVPPTEMGPVVDVDVGLAHACAVDTDGVVWCWGDPIGFNDGQTNVPVGLPPASAIVSGYQFNCALLVDGGVQCWGLVSSNDLPIIAGVSNAVQVAAGRAHACALGEDGSVTCWGDSIEGRTGAQVPEDLEPASLYLWARRRVGVPRRLGV